VSILLWSTVASAFKITLRELDYVQLLFFAALFSLLSLFVVLAVRGRLDLLLHLAPRDILRYGLLGLINPTLYYLILFRAYDLLPAQEAQPLNWTWPIMLTILSAPLLKQKLTIRKIVAVFISFTGVLIVATRGRPATLQFTDPVGDLLAISSSVLWALFWIFNVRDKRDPAVKLFYCFLFGSIYNLIAVFALSDFSALSLKGFTGAAYVGLFEMGITFMIWLKALSLSKDSASVGTLAYITPFLSLVFIYFIVGERILLSSVAGLMLIVVGILLQMLRRGSE